MADSTEQTEGEQREELDRLPPPDAAAVGDPPTAQVDAPAPVQPEAPWHRRHHRAVFIGSMALAFLVGMMAVVPDRQAARDEAATLVAEARDEAEQVRDEAEGDAEQVVDDATADADDRVESLEARVAELRGKRDDLQAAIGRERGTLREVRSALETTRSQLQGARQQVAQGTIDGDGTYLVGEDITPGTWRSDGGSGCYWARLSGLGGDLGDILANSIGDGPQVVSISSSDRAFETSGCGTWQRSG